MSISYNPNYYFSKAQQFFWILKPIYQYKNCNNFCQFLNHYLPNQKVSTYFINFVHPYLSEAISLPNGNSFHQFVTTLLIESRRFKVFFSILQSYLLNQWRWWWWWWWIVYVVWLTDERRSLISSRDHCQRSSPSRISDTPRAGFEPAQNLSSGFDEWSCAIVITTTPRRQQFLFVYYNPTYRVTKPRQIFDTFYQYFRTILIKLQKHSSFDLFLTTIFISSKIISTVL